MNALALLLPVALQAGPAHAGLHPPDADLFLEVSGIPEVLSAFDRAPLVQTLRDEEIRTFLASLGDVEDVHPRAAVGRILVASFPDANLAAFVEAVETLSFSVRLSAGGPDEDGSALVVRAAADFLSEELAGEAEAALLALAGTEAPAAETNALEWAFASSTPSWCGVRGRRLFVDFGAAGAPLDPDGWTGGLADTALLDRGRASFTESSGATVLWCLQRRSPLDVLAAIEPDLKEMTTAFGGGEGFLDQLLPLGGARLWRMQLREERFVTETFAEGPASPATFDGTFLNRLPLDAMFIYGAALDGVRIAAGLRNALAGRAAEETDADPLDEDLERSLDAVLGKLGTDVAACVLPIKGLGLPDSYAWFDIAELDGFDVAMGELVERLGQSFPGLSGRTRDYKVKDAAGERIPFPITTVTLPQGMLALGPMISVTPAFTIADGKLLVGTSSMNVKRELKRLYGPEADGAAAGSSLAAHGFVVPEDASSVFFMDWGLQIETAFDLLRALAGMMGDEIPFSIDDLPEAEVWTRHLRPSFHVARRLEGASYRIHEASFGPETWLGIASLILESSPSEPTVIPVDPADPPPPAPVDGSAQEASGTAGEGGAETDGGDDDAER